MGSERKGDQRMSGKHLAKTVAPCGLVCGMCKNATPEKGSCPGCQNEGGPEECHQRDCSAEKGLPGCWECGDFPCDKGYFAESDDVWRGLCVGLVQCVQQYGLQGYVDRMSVRIGKVIEYGDYRFMNAEQIRRALCGS